LSLFDRPDGTGSNAEKDTIAPRVPDSTRGYHMYQARKIDT
jgi:hypothetical protein